MTRSRSGGLLPRAFYARDALVVARELLGKELWRGGVRLRITEVEAYRYPDDTANHCRMGKTPRNSPMWGVGGHAYVYLCYGMHHMLNLVTGPEGEGAAVLIRSCEVVRGAATVAARRGGRTGPDALTGPGKVGAALELSTAWSGHALFRAGGLSVHDAPAVTGVLAGPRVGIDYAEPRHRDAPWRLAVAGTRWVSLPKRLEPAR